MKNAHDAAWVRPIGLVHDIDNDRFFVRVAFLSVTGNWATTMIARSQLDDPRGAKRVLAGLGADIPDAWLQPLKAALTAQDCAVLRSTAVMGWHSDNLYLLPDSAIGKASDLSPLKPVDADRCTRGSTSAWRDGLASPCSASSFLTFAVAVGFAGCLLRLLGQDEGAVFHFVGESSTGKSLASLAAQSVTERAGRESMRSHDLTDRALEEEAAACNDSLLVLDEIGRVEGTRARRHQRLQKLSYMLCGGQGRRRSEKAVSDLALRNLSYRLLGISSGEELIDGSGIRQRNDGEKVRLIGIPIPGREDGGIFDREHSAETRSELASMVEETVAANFGFPLREFVSELVVREDAEEVAMAYADRFHKRVVPAASPFADRFARKFGVVYAAAMLAADYRLAPWTRKQAGRAIGKIYRRAWEQVRPPTSTAADFLAWLRSHGDDNALFPEVGRGEKVSAEQARTLLGIRREISGRPVIAMLRDRLGDFVPDGQARDVEAALASGGILLPGKEAGRYVRQLRVKGLEPGRRDFLLFDLAEVRRSDPSAQSDAA